MSSRDDKIADSHKKLDDDDWYTNFGHCYQDEANHILFAVSSGRTVGRWFGYVTSIGISSLQDGNRLSEMEIIATDGDQEILEKLLDDFKYNNQNIGPNQIKVCIKRNRWYVEDYTTDLGVKKCSSGLRVLIKVRKQL